jgi:hypothetical protein
MPASATPLTKSIAEESWPHSATASAPPRSASTLSTADRPASPAAMMAKARRSLMI